MDSKSATIANERKIEMRKGIRITNQMKFWSRWLIFIILQDLIRTQMDLPLWEKIVIIALLAFAVISKSVADAYETRFLLDEIDDAKELAQKSTVNLRVDEDSGVRKIIIENKTADSE